MNEEDRISRQSLINEMYMRYNGLLGPFFRIGHITYPQNMIRKYFVEWSDDNKNFIPLNDILYDTHEQAMQAAGEAKHGCKVMREI